MNYFIATIRISFGPFLDHERPLPSSLIPLVLVRLVRGRFFAVTRDQVYMFQISSALRHHAALNVVDEVVLAYTCLVKWISLPGVACPT